MVRKTIKIFKGVQEHCKAKGMQMIYALQRSVDKGVNQNSELAKIVGMKPSGGQCVPDMYFVAQGLVKAVANVVTSDYANLDIPKNQYRHKLMLDCVKCGDPTCTKKAKARCVKEGARVKIAGGTDCPVSKIKWLGVANQLEFEAVPDSLE